METKITKDFTVGDVVQKYPSATEILARYGVHCVGCSASPWETIEQGFKGHGMTDEEINNAVKELNDHIKSIPKTKIETIEITEKAATKVREILKEEGKEDFGLRIEVIPGGCSGFKYNFDFDKTSTKDDTIVERNSVRVFIDNASMRVLKGSRIDYINTLQESGFKISNPNATNSCGCGKSFG